jgi:hypothetical protein
VRLSDGNAMQEVSEIRLFLNKQQIELLESHCANKGALANCCWSGNCLLSEAQPCFQT